MSNLVIIGSLSVKHGWQPCNPPQPYTAPEEAEILPPRKPPQLARSEFDSEILRADVIQQAEKIARKKRMP